MIKPNIENVDNAFEIVLNELEKEIQRVNAAMSIAASEGDYEQAESAIEVAKSIKEFCKRVKDLKDEWKNVAVGVYREKMNKLGISSKRNVNKLKRGEKTSAKEFYIPILKALEEEGGAAIVQVVIKRVGELMAGKLKPKDYEPVPSNPNEPRWCNTAKWARYHMAKEGLLKDDSPIGIWEITEKGRNYLKWEE